MSAGDNIRKPPGIAPLASAPRSAARPSRPPEKRGPPPMLTPANAPAALHADPTNAGVPAPVAPPPPPAPLSPGKIAPLTAVSPLAPVLPPALPAVQGAIPPEGPVGELSAAQLERLFRQAQSLTELDYFQILGLEPTATPADIKKAFYRESRTFHPDRFFHLTDEDAKRNIHTIYKRVTEAYYVLRDDAKRRTYTQDIEGARRAQKLRFTEASEAETRATAKREQEEQFGTTLKGRQFCRQALSDIEKEAWASAERNLKLALTYEPGNARFKEMLQDVQKRQSASLKIT